MIQQSVHTLDEALASVGFGNFQYLVLAYAGLGWFSEAAEIMILSFIGPAVKSQWGLSPGEESLLTTIVFAGELVGAYFWGLISDIYGRKKGILCMNILITGAGLLSAFSPNYTALLIFRCLVGNAIGGCPVFLTWFLEFVPASNRGTWTAIFAIFWTVGTLFEASLAWIVMPRLNWRWLLALSSIPSFAALLFYPFVPESARYLSVNGRIAEAHRVLERMAQLNKTQVPSGVLVTHKPTAQVEESGAPETTPLLSSTTNRTGKSMSAASSIIMLFSSGLVRTTLLVWVLIFGNTFLYYGIVLLTSELSIRKSKCGVVLLTSANFLHNSLYADTFITSLSEFPGLLLSAVLVDRIGRKYSTAIMLLLTCGCLLPLVFFESAILNTALLFGGRMFSIGAFTVSWIYILELYPTSIRATGSGVAGAVGRIGGMICPLVAVGLVNGCHLPIAVILFAVVTFIAIVSVLSLPYETKGQELSDT